MEGGEEGELVLPKEPVSKLLARQAEERAELKKKTERIRSSIPRKDRAGRARAAEEALENEKCLLKRQEAERKERGLSAVAVAEDISGLYVDVGSMPPESKTDASNESQGTESKASRRRRKKAEKEAESRRRIEQEKANMGPSPKLIETEAITSQLRPQGLRIHSIPADGHCLYSAVRHQMELTKCDVGVPASVQGLRKATADYLLSHKDEFMPYIEGVDGDEALFEKYCEQLKNEAVWGGQVELNVLAKILRASIEVYAADMPVVRMGDNSRYVLRLSFHRQYFGLGEHYNSVAP